MTREEAIKILERRTTIPDNETSWDDINEAIDMAVAAICAKQTVDGAVEGMCCDCLNGGPCCDYSENTQCPYNKPDGSCWTPKTPVKLDRSRWEGCGYCSDPEDAESFDFAYCPYCGTPQTKGAWEEQEGRINGGTTD